MNDAVRIGVLGDFDAESRSHKALNDALRGILADADVKKRLLELGIEAKASTPQEISARLKSDIDKWRDVIEKAGIQKQ